MSNSKVVICDTTKRYCVKFFGDANEVRALKIDAGSLSNSLNANGQLLGAGTDRLALYPLSLNRVWYDVSGGDTNGVVKITTDGSAAINSVISLAKSGDLRFDEGGFGAPINVVACGTSSTGNLFFDVMGFQGSNASYTVVLDFRKDNRFYDAGKFADPTAFNWSSTGNNKNKGPS